MDRAATPPPPSRLMAPTRGPAPTAAQRGSEHAALAKAASRWGKKAPAAKRAAAPASTPAVEESRARLIDQHWAYVGLGALGGYETKQDRSAGAIVTEWDLRVYSRQFVVAAIIETLVTELSEFGRKQQSPYSRGYQMRLREAKRAPTRIEQKALDAAADEIQWCGVLSDNDDRFYRHTFSDFLRLAGKDSLVLDRAGVEFLPDAAGMPAQFLALDGARLRHARDPRGRRFPVMLGAMSLSAEASWPPGDPHSAFIIQRRIQTDLELRGYGTSELEDSIQILNGIARAFEHNARYLEHGLSAAGVLALHEKTNPALVGSVKQFIEATMMGAQNNRRVAVMSAPDGKPPTWIPFSAATMKDMEFSAFLNFLLKLLCALYKIDPMLIGFQFGNEGQKASLGQASGKDRIQYAQIKGVWSLARALFRPINHLYVQRKWEDFELVPAGLDTETEEERNARDKEAEWEAWNETRARRDLEKFDATKIKNPADVPRGMLQHWIQWNASQPPEGGEDGGQMGPGGAPVGPDGAPASPSDAPPGRAQGDDGPGADGREFDMGRLFDEAASAEDEPVRKSLMAALGSALSSQRCIVLDRAA